jgi:putative membrane protein
METRFNILARLGLVTVTVGALYLLTAGSIQMQAATNESGALSPSDRTFIKKAAKGGEMEVTMGNIAAQNAINADVKSFGQRMVTDHSKANEELMAIAEKKGVKLPTQEPSEKWTSDKVYIDMMAKDHEKDLAEFQKEASETNDPDLKQFAEQTAKVVQEHLDLAKEAQGKLK